MNCRLCGSTEHLDSRQFCRECVIESVAWVREFTKGIGKPNPNRIEEPNDLEFAAMMQESGKWS